MQVEPHPTNEEDDIGQMYSSKWIHHHLFMAVESTNSPLPKQYRDVLKLSKKDQELWKSAMNDEIKSLHERKVWKLVDLRVIAPSKGDGCLLLNLTISRKQDLSQKDLHRFLE